jgi:SEL1 protein
MLGFMYATGIGDAVEPDQSKALMYHRFAAEAGNTRSEMTLAFRYHVGIGAPRNCDQVVHYYKRVADKAIEYYRSGPPGGHTMPREASRWADEEGGVYGEGASVSSSGPNANQNNQHSNTEASLEDVIEYFDLMSKKGELKATFSLGKMHYDGARTLPRDFRKAMKYFRAVTRLYWNKDGSILPNHLTGIDKVAAKAAGYIGTMYLRGEGVERNFDNAAMWFKRGIARGDALCHHSLGLMYLHGYGLPQDAYRASLHFKAAAEEDFPAAETRLGALFLDQGDIDTATKYFDLAARYGWMEAFYYLAEIANSGIGRERHCGMASAYYKMVAEKAESIHSSFAESNAAYANGDKETAFIGSLMAAEQGYEYAQANVAYLLDEQRTVLSLSSLLPSSEKPRPSLLRNAALALIYWTRSARQSNVDSLVKMGDYYLNGIGTKPDPDKAATCYHTAAEAHHSAQAYWNLGWMHENGVAVEQDFHIAKRYYDLALETNQEAYLPVKLSLIKLRIRDFWDRITNGNVNPIQDEAGECNNLLKNFPFKLEIGPLTQCCLETRPARTFKEWIITFLENDDEEEARYQAQLYGQREDGNEILTGGSTGRRAENDRRNEDTGYYDELDLDIDESLLEGLVIVALAATLLILVYVRQQRNRQRENANNAGAAPAAGRQVPNNNINNNNNNDNNDRGLFPQPGQPEFRQWVAGGIGH